MKMGNDRLSTNNAKGEKMAFISRTEKRKIPIYDNPDEIQAGEVDIDYEKCSGCLVCIKICPASALVKNNNKLVMNSKKPTMKPAELNECMACGDCAAICSENAIVVKKSLQCSGFYKTLEHGELFPPRL